MKFWFSSIKDAAGALKMIRLASVVFLTITAMQAIILILVLSASKTPLPEDFVLYGVVTVLIGASLTAALWMWNSRIAASLLMLFYLVVAASTAATRVGNLAMAIIAFFVSVRATQATFKLHGKFAKPSSPLPPSKSYDVVKWQTLLKYDADLAKVAERLSPLGEKWVDQLAHDFLALNDKRYLPEIVAKVIADAKQAVQNAERISWRKRQN